MRRLEKILGRCPTVDAFVSFTKESDMKVYKVHCWPKTTSRDGRWTVIVDTAEAIEKCGEQWVLNGRTLEPLEGWFADRQEALDHAADAIEAAGHVALEQAQELRGGVTA